MLLKHLNKQVKILQPRLRYCVGTLRALATSTNVESAVEYEIDFVSLKKTPKKNDNRERSQNKLDILDKSNLGSLSIKPDLVVQCIQEAKKDPLDYTEFPKNDTRGYLEFISRYTTELKLFLDFIRKSYGGKIKRFDQLNSKEVMNSLYIFKDLYSKRRVEAVNRYNYTSYNYMVERLAKYLNMDANFPVFLQNNLFNDFESNKVIMDLYKYGIGKFYHELVSLSKEFDFSLHTIREITNRIDDTITQFDGFLVSRKADFDEDFFRCYLQVKRYQNLKHILEALPVNSNHLLYIINNENSKIILQKLNEASGEKASFFKSLEDINAELRYVYYVAGEKFENFPQLVCFLYGNLMNLEDEVSLKISSTILQRLTPYFIEGTIKDSDLRSFDIESTTPLAVSGSIRDIYEFSVLVKSDLHEFIDGLVFLKKFTGKDFKDLCTADALNQSEALTYQFESNTYLHKTFEGLTKELKSVSKYISWNLSVIDDLIRYPQWVKYLSQVSSIADSASVSKLDLSKCVATDHTYVQLPEDLTLHEFDKELETMKNVVLKSFPFAYFTPDLLTTLLKAAIDKFDNGSKSSFIKSSDISHYRKLYGSLVKTFKLNGGNTEILDSILKSREVLSDVNHKIERNQPEYVQIPDNVKLHEHVKELKLLRNSLGVPFGLFLSEEIAGQLNSSINRYLDQGNNADLIVKSDNVKNFIKLEDNLKLLFSINPYTETLDTFLHSQSIFDKFELKKSSNASETYKQIPDDLELHKFSKELEILRNDEIKCKFADIESKELLRYLDRRIDVIHNNLEAESKIASRMTKDNIHQFMRLSKRLTRLFDANGGYTPILDTLIQSQSVFEMFEKKKERKCAEPRREAQSTYKQVPDGFMLEDYMLEVIQLKSELGGSDFKEHACSAILDTLHSMANNERKYNLDKRIIYYKLYRNLLYLFKYNGRQSFILDNVLVNGEVFTRFEADRLVKRNMTNADAFPHEEIVSLFANYQFEVGKLLEELSYSTRKEISQITAKDFGNYLISYLSDSQSKDTGAGTFYECLDCIRKHNEKIEHYAFLLYELNNMRMAGKQIDKTAIELAILSVTNAVNQELEQNNNSKAKISVPLDESSNRFDISEFKDTKEAATSYNDPDELLSRLSKQHELASLEHDRLKSESFSRSQNSIKDAITTVIHNTEDVKKEAPKELEELAELTAEKVRNAFKLPKAPIKSIPASKIDKSSIQKFLVDAKNEKDLANETKFRERKAYEWSKSMLNSNRSLESNNFFNPRDQSETSNERRSKVQYLVLKSNGQMITSDVNPLGKFHMAGDMFNIFDELSEAELNKFLKMVRKLQRKDWKLIGSGGKNEKLLVLSRSIPSKKQKLLGRAKNLFATTGAVVIALVGLQLWFDETQETSDGNKSVISPSSTPSSTPTVTPTSTSTIISTSPTNSSTKITTTPPTSPPPDTPSNSNLTLSKVPENHNPAARDFKSETSQSTWKSLLWKTN